MGAPRGAARRWRRSGSPLAVAPLRRMLRSRPDTRPLGGGGEAREAAPRAPVVFPHGSHGGPADTSPARRESHGGAPHPGAGTRGATLGRPAPSAGGRCTCGRLLVCQPPRLHSAYVAPHALRCCRLGRWAPPPGAPRREAIAGGWVAQLGAVGPPRGRDGGGTAAPAARMGLLSDALDGRWLSIPTRCQQWPTVAAPPLHARPAGRLGGPLCAPVASRSAEWMTSQWARRPRGSLHPCKAPPPTHIPSGCRACGGACGPAHCVGRGGWAR